MSRKIFFRWVKVVVLLYSITGIAFYYLQDQILFHPEKIHPDTAFTFKVPFKEVYIPYNQQSAISIVQFTPADSLPKGVVLYFHGNEKNITRYAEYAPLFTRNRYEVWMIDYPGFGKSTGDFTEKTLYEWALQLYKLAEARFSKDSIVIYGKSLGTGIAAQLASIRDCKKLILETPYYDFRSVVRRYLFLYPLNRMMPYHLPTWQYLQKTDAPVTIFHGTADGVIPYSNAERLKQFLKPGSSFITIEGASHNRIYDSELANRELNKVLQ